MIRASIIVLLVGLAQGALNWYDLPGFYLSTGTSNVKFALEFAARLDDLRFSPSDVAMAMGSDMDLVATQDFNEEELKAIRVYTGGSKVNARVNYALRSLDFILLTAWSPFLKIFHEGVAKQELFASVLDGPIYRGDGFHYGTHAVGNNVSLPMSFSVSRMYVNARLTEAIALRLPCTLVRLYAQTFRYIGQYGTMPEEVEVIMLPGSLGRIVSITDQNQTNCRTIELIEILYTSNNRPTNVMNLIPPDPLGRAGPGQQSDDFLRTYYEPKFSERVANRKLLNITIKGGLGDPYNPWPYITSLIYTEGATSKLSVGQILVGVNEYSTRGMLQEEVQQLIERVKKNQQQETTYIVAVR